VLKMYPLAGIEPTKPNGSSQAGLNHELQEVQKIGGDVLVPLVGFEPTTVATEQQVRPNFWPQGVTKIGGDG
jgi:hypothetical protein